VSFLQRAREAAEAAAEGAQHAAEAARSRASEVVTTGTAAASDPATHERLGRQAKGALGMARKGMTTMVERIDAGTLAELIIKATALQEKTNASLREKMSPYRIAEIVISASIPPGVSFTISRIGEVEILSDATAVTSAELIATLPEIGESVIALDGTVADTSADEAAADI
jgi:hypothetical protein